MAHPDVTVPSADRPDLTFVHGLWMSGVEALALRRRLERDHGFEVRLFTYRTTRESLESVVDRLGEHLQRGLPGGRSGPINVVAHSLGGLVTLACLDRLGHLDGGLPSGRLVLLGSPVRGSAAARVAESFGLGRWLIGGATARELVAPRRCHVPSGWAIGTIAGTRPMGLGRLLARFDEPNDGTVAVAETQLTGACDRLVLPVSHLGMLMSARVADACGRFLREGRFPLQP